MEVRLPGTMAKAWLGIAASVAAGLPAAASAAGSTCVAAISPPPIAMITQKAMKSIATPSIPSSLPRKTLSSGTAAARISMTLLPFSSASELTVWPARSNVKRKMMNTAPKPIDCCTAMLVPPFESDSKRGATGGSGPAARARCTSLASSAR